jgi:hypothetical protein
MQNDYSLPYMAHTFLQNANTIKYFIHISIAAGSRMEKAEIWPVENSVQFMAVFRYYYWFCPPLILLYHT